MGVDQAYARARRENVEDVRAAGEGARNETLNRAAYATAQLAAAAGFDPAECRGELLAAAKAAGLDEREAVATIRSAWASGEGNPRAFDRADKPRPMFQGNPQRVAAFSYCDAEGEERYRKVRIEPGSQGRAKEFVFEHFRDGEWRKGRGGDAIAYRFAEIAAADPGEPLYLAEGEAKADRLAQWGLLATSLKDLPDSALSYVADRDCIILPDNDATGLKLARATAKRIEARGGRPLILKPFEGVGQGGDILDWQGDPEALSGLVRAAYAGDRVSLEDDAPEAEPAQAGNALPLEWAGDVRPILDGLWLIDHWLPAHGIAALYGHSGTGKSFLALDMALRVALGWPFDGRHVEQGLCVYVVAEGQTAFRNRIAGFRQVHGLPDDVPLALIPTAIDMQARDGDTARLIEAIRMAAAARSASPALIVLDTLSKTFGAGKENTDDMAAYVANCQRVADAFQCCTLIVHHRPKDESQRDLRGHSSLRAGVETTILIESAGSAKIAETLKQKDGPDHERIGFSLQTVELGTDRRGEPVTTCVIDYASRPAITSSNPVARAIACLSPQARIVFDAIAAAVKEHGRAIGEPVPADQYSPMTALMVASGQAADKVKEALWAGIGGDPDKRADSVERAFRRHLQAMKGKQILGSWGDWIWFNA